MEKINHFLVWVGWLILSRSDPFQAGPGLGVGLANLQVKELVERYKIRHSIRRLGL
jgi:hypothetical protein